MSAENNADHNYRVGYLVFGIFIIGFILVTWAVVSDSQHRAEMEQVINLPTVTPGP
jgi:hypothetical protein